MYWFVTGIVTGYFIQQVNFKSVVTSVLKMYYELSEHTLEPYNRTKGAHVLRYKYKENEYKVLLPPFVRGPPNILDIIDVETGNSVFKEIKPFLGPDQKGHFCHLSPDTFGYRALIVRRLAGDDIDIEGDEPIVHYDFFKAD